MTEREYKKIIVADENNENPRAVTYPEAVANGWIRRAARVFLVNEDGKVLIQKRSRHIAKPQLFDNSAAGHVDEGEEYIDAAVRELKEELGVVVSEEDLELMPVIRETNFFAANYRLRVSNDIEIKADEFEVEDLFWMTPQEIDDFVFNKKEMCTDSLVEVWNKLRDNIINI